MITRPVLVIGLRLLAAVAVVVFAVLALNRATADVTFTFPASDTGGLSDDVVYKCGSAPTSFEDSGGGVQVEGSEAYDDWVLARAKETTEAPDTSEVTIAACEAARDSRLITLVWLITGALTAGLVFVGSLLLRTTRQP